MIQNTNFDVMDSPLIAWDNLIGRATVTASSSAAGFPVTALQNGVTSDPWVSGGSGGTVFITLPAPEFASVLSFAAHNLFTRGVTVFIARRVGSNWVNVTSYTPTSDGPFMVSFPPVSASEWRVVMTATGAVSVAVMSLSLGLTIPGRIVPPHTPLHRVSEVELVGDSESGTGSFLQADFERMGGRAQINFSVQLNDFATGDEFEAFRQNFNRGRPFFMACFPRSYPQDMGYVWRGQRADSIVPAWQDAVFMSIGMVVSVYVR